MLDQMIAWSGALRPLRESSAVPGTFPLTVWAENDAGGLITKNTTDISADEAIKVEQLPNSNTDVTTALEGWVNRRATRPSLAHSRPLAPAWSPRSPRRSTTATSGTGSWSPPSGRTLLRHGPTLAEREPSELRSEHRRHQRQQSRTTDRTVRGRRFEPRRRWLLGPGDAAERDPAASRPESCRPRAPRPGSRRR
jgi:hypothetical protein